MKIIMEVKKPHIEKILDLFYCLLFHICVWSGLYPAWQLSTHTAAYTFPFPGGWGESRRYEAL